ncbi:hypothetical protein PV08_08622 [Exophiala spinifera]|uniref:Acyltransferase 3 domain-containing protein n=1 Tax=Exophiala spinifera TaxID=91928 RepID=A0A0D2BQM7_9EURO|nr:uncharacterized protein PV08_08622 [Exophiala spinifera]KIW13434.1 hypothetical protein PV08_08622 [Exophiala spinifera]
MDIIPAEAPSRTPAWALLSEKEKTHTTWKQLLVAALPRFMQPGGLPSKKIGPTSYLDALRGYAALIVVFFHIFPTPEAESSGWRRQPFLNLLDSGKAMVILFFVISGYALGYRLLILTRQGDAESLLNALSSSTFRRYFRLYLSSAAACAFSFPFVRMQWYNTHKGLYKPSLIDNIIDFCIKTGAFLNPFGAQKSNPYLYQLWTIPVEYRGSMVLFLVILITCKLSTRDRMIATWLIILACYVWEVRFQAEFLSGFFIADLSMSRRPERMDRRPSFSRGRSIAGKVGWSLVLVVGLFLVARPKVGNQLGFMKSVPWEFLDSLVPSWYGASTRYAFWISPGAFAVVLAIESYPTLQTPFHWRISQYVGDLSFGLYAIHPPVGHTLTRLLTEPLRQKFLNDTFLAHIPGFILVMLAVFIAADYFERVDRRSVRLARWLQKKVFV